MQTIIFTDGSSKGNPGPGGWGAVVCYTNEGARVVEEIGGHEDHTTNNRMEMTAVIEAIKFAKNNAPLHEIIIHTDSEYVKKGATEWMFSWEKNNWRTKSKTPVLNQDLWQKMMDIIAGTEISWRVIPGHSGIQANERCDVIATSFADNSTIKLFSGNADEYKVSLEAKRAFGNNK